MWKKGYMNKADIITPGFVQIQTKKQIQGLFKAFSKTNYNS